MGVSVKAAWLKTIRDKPAQQQQKKHVKAKTKGIKPSGRICVAGAAKLSHVLAT